MPDIHRHDLKKREWLVPKPHLPGLKGNRRRQGADNRFFVNAVLWHLRTGTPWPGLPEYYGKWKIAHAQIAATRVWLR